MSFAHVPIKLELMHTLLLRLEDYLVHVLELSRRAGSDGGGDSGGAPREPWFASERAWWRLRRQRAADAVREARWRWNTGVLQAQQRTLPSDGAAVPLANRTRQPPMGTAYLRRRRLMLLHQAVHPG